MNKVIKGLFATAALASLIGTVQVNAQEVDLKKLTDISAHTEGDTKVYDSLYIFGQNVHKSYITAFDISEAVLNNVKKDPNIYYKAPTGTAESTLVSLNHPDTQIDKTKKFEMVRLIGALDGDHVSQDKSLYTDGYYIGLEDTTYYGTRKSEIFATNKAKQPEVKFTELTTHSDNLLGFDKDKAYGKENSYKFTVTPQDDRTIELTGLVKHQDLYYNGQNADTVKGYYFAYELTIPEANENTVIYLNNGKAIKYNDLLNHDQVGAVVVKLDETTPKEDRIYTIKVDLDGDGEAYAPTEIVINWSELKFEKDSEAEVVKEATMSNEWKFDASHSVIDNITYDEENKTYTLTGNLTKQSVAGFGSELTEGFYFTLGIKLGTNDATTIEVKNNKGDSQFKKTVKELKEISSFDDYDETTGILGLIWKTAPAAENKKFTITIDLDGDGELYTPVTYTIDYSKVTFGAESPSEVTPIDNTAKQELSTDFGWNPGTNYHVDLKTDKDDIHTIYAEGFIPKGSVTEGTYDNATGYYFGFTVIAEPNFAVGTNVRETLKNMTVTVTSGNTSKVIPYDSFDSDTMLYMLAMLDPTNTDVKNRKIKVAIDYDGEGFEYAPEEYIIDWSRLSFEDTASATITTELDKFTEELSNYGYDVDLSKVKLDSESTTGDFTGKYKITGDLYEQQISEELGFDENKKFFFALAITPKFVTNLHPGLTKIPEGSTIKITNGVDQSGNSQSDSTTAIISADSFNEKDSEVVLLHVNETNKYVLVEIDFGSEYAKAKYLVDYSAVKLYGTTKTEVKNANEVVDFVEGLKSQFGYDLNQGGKIEISEEHDLKGDIIYKAKGYATKLNLDTYGKPHDSWNVPFTVLVSNSDKISKVTLNHASTGSDLVVDKGQDLEDIKKTGRIDVLREISTDGSNYKEPIFSLIIEYVGDSGVEYKTQTLKFDFSDVKFDLLGEFITAYRETEVKGLNITDTTTITTGESNKLTSEIQGKVDWFKLVSDEIAQSAVGCESKVEGKKCLKVTVNKSKFVAELTKYSKGVTFAEDLFSKDLTFDVVLNADGLVESIAGKFNSQNGLADGKNVQYGDSSQAVVTELNVNYAITDYSTKTNDVVVYTEDENEAALGDLNTEYNNQVENKNEGAVQNIELSTLTEDKFNKVYTEVARVENADLTKITINGKEYDNKPHQTGIGNNVFLNLPVFYVKDDVLYVSTTELTVAAVKNLNNVVKVNYDGCEYAITTGLTPADGKLSIKEPSNDIKVVFKEEGYDQDLTTSYSEETGEYTVKLKSGHGKQLIAIKLYAGETSQLVTDGNIYIYDENGNIALDTIAGTIDGEQYTYGIYLDYNAGQPYKEAHKKTVKQTIYVEGKGSITINFELDATVKSNP